MSSCGAGYAEDDVKMMCKALTLLNRYYVKRLSLTTVEGVASPEQAALRQAFGV